MPTLRQWLKEEDFTLSLSSGFFGVFAHAGVIFALEESGLIPAKVSGASAGALAGGCWAAGCSSSYLKDLLFKLRRKDFWDPSFGLGFLKGERFRDYLEDITPVSKIEECPVPLHISVYDFLSNSTHVLEQGSISESIYASCAVPFMFQPIKINNRFYFDGGIKDRSGLAGVSKGCRVLCHHLLSWGSNSHIRGLNISKRSNMTMVVIHQLRAVNPYLLKNGRSAFMRAREAMLFALDQPTDLYEIHVR